jgi:Na+-driven multidrug efflux pump
VGVLLRGSLLTVFTEDKAVIALGANVILINVALEMGRTTNLVVIACLRGTGDVLYPTLCAIFSMIFISTLGSYIFAVVLDMGIYGLWIANALDECFRGVLMLIRWKNGKWRTKSIAG